MLDYVINCRLLGPTHTHTHICAHTNASTQTHTHWEKHQSVSHTSRVTWEIRLQRGDKEGREVAGDSRGVWVKGRRGFLVWREEIEMACMECRRVIGQSGRGVIFTIRQRSAMMFTLNLWIAIL